MAKSEQNYSSDPDSTWNASKVYSEGVIINLVLKCNAFTRLAQSGTEEDQLAVGLLEPIPTELAQLEGMEKLISELRLIIETTYFKMSKPNKQKFNKMEEELKQLRGTLNLIRIIEKDQVTGNITIKLEPTLFEATMEALRRLNKQIKIPLHEAGLLYQVSKQRTKEDIIEMFKKD